MTLFTNILVPVDFSDCSRGALKMALAIAQAFGSQLSVLHVWQPPEFAGADLLVMAHAQGVSIGEYGKEKAADALEAFLDECQAPEGVRREVIVGDPRYAIVDRAKSLGADLIVLGTQGRSGRARLFAGSVAEGVVRRAHVPVMTVRRPKTS